MIPKLFIFVIPTLLIFVDKFVSFIYTKENHKFVFTIIVLGLTIGQTINVGVNTYNSWNRTIENEDCVTVNNEYFLRATKGLNYTYNQISMEAVEKCKQNKLE